ncbi:TonB-dependent receptor domain-containing protein [Variovorax sp. N23]|uniref:TonB-dependent receptor domain-containing protein n=1 Tax=Variovorax sp. N23 TaxID=2980555 RepID=UPI0021C700F7|nr:TonB-dependent receptor [Variovorax sp. N23]MCU4119225.1 TonB-dependent receptor [Variovorax sp. N23]
MIHCIPSAGARLPVRARLALVPLAVAAAFPAVAQGQAGESTLRETVVTATRVEQPLSDLVADVSIVDRATIERSGATGVVDVLARLPGIEIGRSGGIGNASSVFIRGAESRFTAVYIDGVRIDSQSTGGAAWEGIPLSQIDRIEVLRGPAAAVYGSDAIGGVIQLFTRRGEGAATPFVGVGIGSHNLRRAEAGLSGSAGEGGAFDYSLGVSHEESDGYNIQPLDKRTPSRDGWTSPDRDGYRNTAANARLGFQINPAHRLEGTFLYSDTVAQYDNASRTARPPAVFPDDTGTHTLRTAGLAWVAKWNDIYSTRLQLTDGKTAYQTVPSFYRTETETRGYLFQNNLNFGAHRITAALERREDELDNAATSAFSPRLARDRSQNAVSLGYGFVQGPHSLQLQARHDDDSEFGGKTTGSAAYGFAITPQWRATASVGTAFRAPTLYQRFSEYGLASLQPEKSRNVELGLRWAEGATNVGVVVYRNRVTDLITFAGSATGCASDFGCYSNTARAEYEGLTLSAGHRIGSVTLRASADFQDPRDVDNDRQLARRARRHGTLGADWAVAGWTLGAEVQTSSMRYDDAANTRRLGGYTLLNLVASTKLTPSLTLVARLDNAGDKDYTLARMYATGGRTAYLGLKWSPQ